MTPRNTRSGALRPVPNSGTSEPEPAPEPKRPVTVTDAAGASRRELLVALRSRLAKAVDSSETRPRELAQLARQLSATDEEIRKLDLESGNDEIGKAAQTPDERWNPEAI